MSSFHWDHLKDLLFHGYGQIRVAIPSGRVGIGMTGPEINEENKVNSRNIMRVAALGIACVLGTAVVKAQSAAAAPGEKIGVINLRVAIGSTAEGKQASAELQSQFAARQNELEVLTKQINDLNQRLSSGQATLSDEEKQRISQQGERLKSQGERKYNELQEDINAAQGEVVDRIGRKMMDVLERYSRENGLVAILESSGQNTPLLYHSPTIDVTQDIVKLYDQAYPLKSGSATPSTKPAATTPKPAATTPKPAAPPATKP